MTDEDRLKDLQRELFSVFGRLTKFRRICRQVQAVTVQEQIAIAEEVLKMPCSGSVNEGYRESIRLERLERGQDKPSGTAEEWLAERKRQFGAGAG